MFESKKEMLVFYSYLSPGVFFLRAFEKLTKIPLSPSSHHIRYKTGF